MTEFLFADDYDFNNPRGVFVRGKTEIEAAPSHYPQAGESVILYTEDDGTAFGIVVTVTSVAVVGDNILYHTDYPDRTWRKGRESDGKRL